MNKQDKTDICVNWVTEAKLLSPNARLLHPLHKHWVEAFFLLVSAIYNPNMQNKTFVFFMALGLAAHTAHSQQFLSPNGYSGLGLVPSATVLGAGSATLGTDPNVPGTGNNSGRSTNVGFGLTQGLELVGRLATNDAKCNMFLAGACPPEMIRDFSASFKWAPQVDWLRDHKINLALGATDLGGAATYFRSYYAVASKDLGHDVELRLGAANAPSERAYLKGAMGAVSWRPVPWSEVSLQRAGDTTTAHVGLTVAVPHSSARFMLSLNQKLTGPDNTQKSWVGLGLTLPIDTVRHSARSAAETEAAQRAVVAIAPTQLRDALQKNGFVEARIGQKANGTTVIQVENTAYAWNMADAAGVALGAVASALGASDQAFELVITTRGLAQLQVAGRSACLKAWLGGGAVCSELRITSFNQDQGRESSDAVTWQDSPAWTFRPELQVSPVVASTVGTEYGSFDMDLGANVNLVLPLWKGATLDLNRLESLGTGTRNFEQGGVLFSSRIQTATTRRMLHQMVNIQPVNTQARLSVGTTATHWDGAQIETITQSSQGQHRAGVTMGRFKRDLLGGTQERDYALANYRYAWNDAHSLTTELTYGQFFGGDTGYMVSQRFWHGDTTLTAYMRRTRMSADAPQVAFAGLMLSIPFTPRQNRGYTHFALRGTPQWSYSLETKIMDTDNRLTGGLGTVLNVGEPLATTLNRDRNTSRYHRSQIWRMKDAFNRLYVP